MKNAVVCGCMRKEKVKEVSKRILERETKWKAFTCVGVKEEKEKKAYSGKKRKRNKGCHSILGETKH